MAASTGIHAQDPNGWFNNCGHKLDGRLCMKWVWYKWNASRARPTVFEADQVTPHVHPMAVTSHDEEEE